MLGCKGLSLRNIIMEIRFVQMVNAPEDLFSMVDGASICTYLVPWI